MVVDENAIRRETRDVFVRARSYLSIPSRWKKSPFEAVPNGPTCLYLAVGRIAEKLPPELKNGMDGVFCRSLNILREEVHKKSGRHIEADVYNDEPNTTHADIMEVLDNCIAKT